jgi:hypothetical protein
MVPEVRRPPHRFRASGKAGTQFDCGAGGKEGKALIVAQHLSWLVEPEAVRNAIEVEEVGVYRSHVEKCHKDEPGADRRRLKVFTGRASVERKEFGTAVRKALIELLLAEIRKGVGGSDEIDSTEDVVSRIKAKAEGVAAEKKESAMAAAQGGDVEATEAGCEVGRDGCGVRDGCNNGAGVKVGGRRKQARGAVVRARKNRGSAAWRSALRKELYDGYKMELHRLLVIRADVAAAARCATSAAPHTLEAADAAGTADEANTANAANARSVSKVSYVAGEAAAVDGVNAGAPPPVGGVAEVAAAPEVGNGDAMQERTPQYQRRPQQRHVHQEQQQHEVQRLRRDFQRQQMPVATGALGGVGRGPPSVVAVKHSCTADDFESGAVPAAIGLARSRAGVDVDGRAG